jgi:hypothetical protein
MIEKINRRGIELRVMADPKHNFYGDYSPNDRIQKRLEPPEEDIKYKAPYRDILGILEKHDATTEKNSISLSKIKEELESRYKERERTVTTPSNNRLRGQLEDLYWKGIVVPEGDSSSKTYRKIPDEKVPRRIRLLIINALRKSEEPLETVLCRHTVVSMGVVLYIFSSFFYMLNIVSYRWMSLSVSLYLIGHYMAYRENPLVP